jgi:AcrR family transcriptional regulator
MATMSATPIKMDARRRKSRQRLKVALVSLLGRKSLEKISIEEITREAGVTRPTFYSNYSDRQEIVSEYVEELMLKLTERFDELATDTHLDQLQVLEQFFLYYMELVRENNSIILYAASGRAGDEALDIMRTYNRRFLSDRLLVANQNGFDPEKQKLLVHFLSSAINGVIEAHASRKLEMDEAAVSKTIAQFLHEGVNNML